MININKLKAKFTEKNYNREFIARHLGISTRTLATKLKKGIFNNIEMQKLVELLDIDNPVEIFFV